MSLNYLSLFTRFFLFVFCVSVFLFDTFAQKPFVGKLVYSVEIADSSLQELFPPSKKTIFANDTVVRVETDTPSLGKQILIEHINNKKAYLLISYAGKAYAIQIPPQRSDTLAKYMFKKKLGKRTVGTLTSRKLAVSVADSSMDLPPLEFFYHKKIASKYLPGYDAFPGLLTDYYVYTQDGLFHHRLESITRQKLSYDLFGVPSDFQIISMADFLNNMLKNGNEKQNVEE